MRELYEKPLQKTFSADKQIPSTSDAEILAIKNNNSKIFQIKMKQSSSITDSGENEEANKIRQRENFLLEAKLDNYKELAEFGHSIKKLGLMINIIVMPLIIGMMISVYISTSKNTIMLQDIKAAISAEK